MLLTCFYSSLIVGVMFEFYFYVLFYDLHSSSVTERIIM